MKVNELISKESVSDAAEIASRLAAAGSGYADAAGQKSVSAALGVASDVLGGSYASAGSSLAQAAGADKLAGALDAVSDVTDVTPLGLALDIVSKVATKDPLFAQKLQKATADAKRTGMTQTFEHPTNLLGPLNVIPKLTKFFTGKEMQAQFQVDPQGRLLSPLDNLS